MAIRGSKFGYLPRTSPILSTPEEIHIRLLKERGHPPLLQPPALPSTTPPSRPVDARVADTLPAYPWQISSYSKTYLHPYTSYNLINNVFLKT